MISFNGFSASVTEVGGDEQLVAQLHETIDSKDGWTLQSVIDIDTALACLPGEGMSVAILCVADELSYAQAARFLRAIDPTKTPTIVVHDSLDSSDLLELLRRGAAECLARPVNLSRLSLVLDMLAAPTRAAALKPVGRPRPQAGDDVPPEHNELGLDGLLLDQLRAVAPLDTTVMITGETGAGKTRLARLIHALSPRRNKQFLAVNCGALSESLLDSELFGHSKGAFTGAERDHAGKLAQCENGTLLLDEIDTLSPAAQVKLLQVAEERVFQPVGATAFQPLRARLVVASNKNLETEVAAGHFRSDLFYRLNVMSFRLAPLRERRHEIPRLVEKFAAEFAGHHDMTAPTVLRSALSALESHTWPGNIRELRNVVERAVILSAGGTINPSHLPPHIALRRDAQDSGAVQVDRGGEHNKLATARVEAEREQLLLALSRNNNNRTKTASYLGISRVALYKRLRKFQIA